MSFRAGESISGGGGTGTHFSPPSVSGFDFWAFLDRATWETLFVDTVDGVWTLAKILMAFIIFVFFIWRFRAYMRKKRYEEIKNGAT